MQSWGSSDTSDRSCDPLAAYAATLPQMPVAVYCHYCEDGLELAGVDVRHLAAMLFAGEAGCTA